MNGEQCNHHRASSLGRPQRSRRRDPAHPRGSAALRVRLFGRTASRNARLDLP
jgi:hypothetical protein